MRGLVVAGAAMLAAACAAFDPDISPWRVYASATEERRDIELHATESGTGEPLILIHGFGNSAYTWRHVAPRLAKDYRVIAVDLKGFGRSPKPQDQRYSLYEQARLVRDFIVARDLRNITLIGHSYGGGVALVATLYLADLSPPRQSALVLIDTIAYRQELPYFIRLLTTPLLGPLLMRWIPPETQVRMVMKRVFHDDSAIEEDAVASYADSLRSREGQHATRTTARQMLPPDLDDLSGEYSRIGVPTLIVWARHDDIVPFAVGERLHRAIPQSSLAVVESSGHAPQEERPEALCALLARFLQKR